MKKVQLLSLFVALFIAVTLLTATLVMADSGPVTGGRVGSPPIDPEWLAVIGEENGGIASLTKTAPECVYHVEHQVYICPEPLPAVLPTPDPAARAHALVRLGEVGLLLVPDSYNRRVIAFDPVTGNVLDENFIPPDLVNLDLPISAILSASRDSILVSDYINDVVYAYDYTGNFLDVFAPAAGPNPAILDTPRGMALRPNGNLLVTLSANPNVNAVAEFDTGGNYLGQFIASGAGGLDSPYDIFGRASDWLVGATTSDAIHRYDLNGDYLDDFAAVNNFPQQINQATNNNILVANFSGTQRGIIEYQANGTLVDVYAPISGNYRGVYELPNGRLLITVGTGPTGAVYEIDRQAGLIRTVLAGPLTGRYIEFVPPPPTTTISLSKTVGGESGICATTQAITVTQGTQVTYCYQVTNTGNLTLTTHSLVDSHLGTILTGFPFTLSPGASAFLTQTAIITVTTLNTATWTALTTGGITATSTSTATVYIASYQYLPAVFNEAAAARRP